MDPCLLRILEDSRFRASICTSLDSFNQLSFRFCPLVFISVAYGIDSLVPYVCSSKICVRSLSADVDISVGASKGCQWVLHEARRDSGHKGCGGSAEILPTWETW